MKTVQQTCFVYTYSHITGANNVDRQRCANDTKSKNEFILRREVILHTTNTHLGLTFDARETCTNDFFYTTNMCVCVVCTHVHVKLFLCK